MNKLQFFAFLLPLLCTSSSIHAQTLTPPSITLTTFISGLSSPLAVRNCGDERLFIAEKSSGLIKVFSAAGASLGTFLNVSSLISTGSERGLLGLAFHPNYDQNGYFYINYTNASGNTVIRRYTVSANPNVADATSGLTILTISQPYSNHNGGDLRFGPDGYLYIPTGDGGMGGDPENRSQNPNTLLGKMLRIDVNSGSPYSVPPSNPYVSTPGYLPEIWNMGLRNPWRCAFDDLTGELWIADVGQNAWEEINVAPANSTGAENYGWRCYEGNATFNTTGCQPADAYQFPVAVFSHGAPESFCSITGGVVYRGSQFPGLYGHYLFTDYCEGKIRSLFPDGIGGYSGNLLTASGQAGYVDFGTDNNGELYISRMSTSNTVFKISESCGSFNPQISSSGAGSINASAGANYWWYLNGQIIPGANSQTYTPVQTGNYHCHIQNASGCTRKSNTLNWLVAGGIPGCTYQNAENYNPAAEVDDGSCTFILSGSDCPADLNGDGVVGFADLNLFLAAYGSFCP